MEKYRDIALFVIALAVPVLFFTLAFIPGGFDFVPYLLSHPTWQPVIIYGGILLAIGVLGWRVYRRIHPAPRKKGPASTYVNPTKMPKVEGSEAVRRAREGNGERP